MTSLSTKNQTELKNGLTTNITTRDIVYLPGGWHLPYCTFLGRPPLLSKCLSIYFVVGHFCSFSSSSSM